MNSRFGQQCTPGDQSEARVATMGITADLTERGMQEDKDNSAQDLKWLQACSDVRVNRTFYKLKHQIFDYIIDVLTLNFHVSHANILTKNKLITMIKKTISWNMQPSQRLYFTISHKQTQSELRQTTQKSVWARYCLNISLNISSIIWGLHTYKLININECTLPIPVHSISKNPSLYFIPFPSSSFHFIHLYSISFNSTPSHSIIPDHLNPTPH